ncbi:MAG TPA: glycosyltransferase family 87 protein [Candidatus Limnocylindrales bacterium]|nr:glycosyltransferase family 87 protein [Candidatus Limnocylindrales bacterium]
MAVLSIAVGVGATLAVAGDTLGFDFLAYHRAADRLLTGRPLYDMSYTQTGGFGLFYYPPTFAPFLLPFGALSATSATWTWIVISVAAFVVGALAMPVSMTVRWTTILLAGWSFPFVYAVKLGQVGPILFFLFALGWRWLDRPAILGVVGAVGAAIKLQPGLLLLWALLERRLRAVAAGAVVLALLAGVTTLLAGLTSWTDFLTLIRAVSDPIRTEHNFTPGAIAFAEGASAEVAGVIQLISSVAVAALFLASIRWATDEASYMVAVIASQLLSPILWDHYALLLLVPVAYLLASGRWWAVVIPLVTAWPLVGITPPVAYPVAFWVTLIAVFLVGHAATDPRQSLGEALAR